MPLVDVDVKKFHNVALDRQRKEIAALILVQGSKYFPRLHSINQDLNDELVFATQHFDLNLELNKDELLRLPLHKIKCCLYHILSAVAHLHDLGMVHGGVRQIDVFCDKDHKCFVLAGMVSVDWSTQEERRKEDVVSVAQLILNVLGASSNL